MKKTATYTTLFIFYALVLEFVLTLFDPEVVFVKSFDRNLLFSMYPNRTGIVVSEEYKVKVTTNQYGSRQTNPSSRPNVILFGDSFSEGWGVEENEMFSQIANQILGPENQILNLGVHGSNPALMYLHLKHYLSLFQPKTVYIQIFDNDLDDLGKFETFLERNENEIQPKVPLAVRIFGETVYNVFKESSTFRLARRIIKKSKGQIDPILYYKENKVPELALLSHEDSLRKFGRLSPLKNEIETKYNGQFAFYRDAEHWQNLLKIETDYLEKMFALLNQKNIKMGIIYIPAKEFFAEGGILGNQKKRDLNRFVLANPHHMNLKRFCDTKKVDCMFVSELFWDQNPENLYFPFDAHWNRQGNKVFGEILAKELKKLP